ncbi:unnamed protein product [Peniophora sp. CBMAI 1063]|nr:unnamed protein product [Peniophora sp. CBMAI 1063]
MKFITVAVPLFLSAFATAAPEAAQEKRQLDGLGGDLTAGIGGLTSAVGAGAASLSANGEGLGFTILGTGPNSVLTAAVALGTSTFTLVTTQGGQGYTLGAGGSAAASATTSPTGGATASPSSGGDSSAAVSLNPSKGGGIGFTVLGNGPNSVLTAAVALGTSTFTLVTTQGGQGYTLGADDAGSVVASATAATIPSGFMSSVQSVVSSVSTESVASVLSTSAGGAAPTSYVPVLAVAAVRFD